MGSVLKIRVAISLQLQWGRKRMYQCVAKSNKVNDFNSRGGGGGGGGLLLPRINVILGMD